MKRRLELVGGPYDGHVALLYDPPACVWVEGPGEYPRFFSRASALRSPYFQVISAREAAEQRELRRESYMFAGDSHTVCGGCGAFHSLRDDSGERVSSCALCGRSLERVPTG